MNDDLQTRLAEDPTGLLQAARREARQLVARQATAFDPALTDRQLTLAATAALVRSTERSLAPETLVAALQLGLRSAEQVRVAIATQPHGWPHRKAITVVLPALDDDGVVALLRSAPPPPRTDWPVGEVAARLLAMGRVEAAIEWAASGGAYGGLGHDLGFLWDALAGDPRVAARVRSRLVDLEPEAEATAEVVALARWLPGVERDEALRTALRWLEDEESLWWDHHDDERDPRLVLAEATAAAGLEEETEALLARALANPMPFADGDANPDASAALAFARCANRLERHDLADQARRIGLATLFGRCALVETGLLAPAQLLDRPLGLTDARHLARIIRLAPTPALLDGVLGLLREATSDPDDDHHGTALATGLLQAVGQLAPQLSEAQADEALRCVIRIGLQPRNRVGAWHIAQALVPLLAVRPDKALASAVLDEALKPETPWPPLPSFPAWSHIWTEEQRIHYTRTLLQRRSLADPLVWVDTLAAWSASTTGAVSTQLADASVALALHAGEPSRAAKQVALAGPGAWRQVFEAAREPADPWALADLLEHAPTPEERVLVARSAWSTPGRLTSMGCAGTLFAALAEDEAEAIGATLAPQQRTFIGFGQMPPRMRARAVEELRAGLQPDDPRALAYAWVHLERGGVDATPEREAVLELLLRELPQGNRGAVAAFSTVVSKLGADVLDVLAPAIDAASAPDASLRLAYRWRELGRPDRAAAILAPYDGTTLIGLQARLANASSPDALWPCFAQTPAALTYPWVLEAVRERGWADAVAMQVHDQPVPTRIVVWDTLWPALTTKVRDTLHPALFDAIATAITDSLPCWTRGWDHLERTEVQALFGRSMLASTLGRGLSPVPSRALGRADAHGRVLLEVLALRPGRS